MKASQARMTAEEQRLNDTYWAQKLDLLEHGSRIECGGESNEAGGLSKPITSYEHITED